MLEFDDQDIMYRYFSSFSVLFAEHFIPDTREMYPLVLLWISAGKQVFFKYFLG